MIKLGKNTTPNERSKDVFTWPYEDLKAYREDVIQQSIPLKEDAEPFRLKL